MPSEAPSKPNRQTWREWLPAGMPEPPSEALLSREELLQELHDQGVDVSPRQLVRWQEEGIVPYGERRWRDGSPAVLYAPWMVDIVKELRRLRATGRPLAQIRASGRLRAEPLHHVLWRDPLAEPIAAVRTALADLAHHYERAGLGSIADIEVHFRDDAGKRVIDNIFNLRSGDE